MTTIPLETKATEEFLVAAPESDAAFEIVLLDPTKVTLFRTGGSAVRATISDPQIGAERSYIRVQLARAFPLSRPDRYIGLRDDKDKDIGIMAPLTGLDTASRSILEEELSRRYFVPRIEKVISVKEEFNTATFEVETDRGPRRFLVQKIRDSVQDLPSLDDTPNAKRRLLISDKDGTRYEFPDVDALDSATYTVLQRVL